MSFCMKHPKAPQDGDCMDCLRIEISSLKSQLAHMTEMCGNWQDAAHEAETEAGRYREALGRITGIGHADACTRECQGHVQMAKEALHPAPSANEGE